MQQYYLTHIRKDEGVHTLRVSLWKWAQLEFELAYNGSVLYTGYYAKGTFIYIYIYI